jgi:hypothetical protein
MTLEEAVKEVVYWGTEAYAVSGECVITLFEDVEGELKAAWHQHALPAFTISRALEQFQFLAGLDWHVAAEEAEDAVV